MSVCGVAELAGRMKRAAARALGLAGLIISFIFWVPANRRHRTPEGASDSSQQGAGPVGAQWRGGRHRSVRHLRRDAPATARTPCTPAN